MSSKKDELSVILLNIREDYQEAVKEQNGTLFKAESYIEEKEPIEFKIEDGKVLEKVLSI